MLDRVAAQALMEFSTRGDAELDEHIAQVPLDRAMAEEELRADLLVRQTLPRQLRDLALLPKAHLHVHLESAIRSATLREIATRNGVTVPGHAGDGPVSYAGFRPFADHNALVRNCLSRPEDFTRIAAEFCADEAAQGTRYAELTFTAAAHEERLGRLEMPLEAVLAGLAEGQAQHDIECQVILDHSRRRSVDRAWRTLRLATRYADHGVVGVFVRAQDGVWVVVLAGEQAV